MVTNFYNHYPSLWRDEAVPYQSGKYIVWPIDMGESGGVGGLGIRLEAIGWSCGSFDDGPFGDIRTVIDMDDSVNNIPSNHQDLRSRGAESGTNPQKVDLPETPTEPGNASRRVVFCSFGDSRLRRSKARLIRQATDMGTYNSIQVWDESDLDHAFRAKYENLLRPGSRGFGYWVWKPYLVLSMLDTLNDGDIVHYADIGCWLNPDGKSRLSEYLSIVARSKTGILAFQWKRTNIDDKLNWYTLPERAWTKGDLLDYFSVRNSPEIVDSEQIVATSIFFRKSAGTIRFLHDWLRVWDDSLSLLDDSPSTGGDLNGFIEHRHDQSVFSILGKTYGIDTVSSIEIFYPRIFGDSPVDVRRYRSDWGKLKKFPVWAKRDKDTGIFLKLYRIAYNSVFLRALGRYTSKNRNWA